MTGADIMHSFINSYERSILNLKKKIVYMGEKTSLQLLLAVESLLEQDIDKATEILVLEEEIDNLDHQLELETMELISLQQPMDDDLRTLGAVLRISKDLERIGDLSENIAEIAIKLSKGEGYFKELVDIPLMCNTVNNMLKVSLDAYINKDLDKAYLIDKMDDNVDNLYSSLYEELISCMKKNAEYVEQATCLITVVRFLERIGDHAVNIAEMTIYEINGDRKPFAK